jgi:hypothetical protein
MMPSMTARTTLASDPRSLPPVVGVYHAGMASWARRYGQLFAQWHLLGAATTGAVNRGILTAACGENLGDDEAMLERVEDTSVVGNRCAACQGIALTRDR